MRSTLPLFCVGWLFRRTSRDVIKRANNYAAKDAPHARNKVKAEGTAKHLQRLPAKFWLSEYPTPIGDQAISGDANGNDQAKYRKRSNYVCSPLEAQAHALQDRTEERSRLRCWRGIRQRRNVRISFSQTSTDVLDDSENNQRYECLSPSWTEAATLSCS